MTPPAAKRRLLPLLQAIQSAWGKLVFLRHRRRLEALTPSRPAADRRYLDVQLRRTLAKRNVPLQPRTRLLVDRLADLVDLSRCVVLCVGCRNPAELDYFHAHGAQSVTGIDLYSDHPDILVMDMHHLTFANDRFDVIYSSHSLEHALDPARAIREMLRVARPNAVLAIEVPVGFEPRGADLVDFHDLDTLLAAFRPQLSELLWSEQHRPGPESAADRRGFVRAIFRIEKSG